MAKGRPCACSSPPDAFERRQIAARRGRSHRRRRALEKLATTAAKKQARYHVEALMIQAKRCRARRAG